MARHHATAAHEVSHLVNEIRQLSENEIKSLYGIEIYKDGSVFDPTYNMKFDTVAHWATFTIDQDDVSYEQAIYNKFSNEDFQ